MAQILWDRATGEGRIQIRPYEPESHVFAPMPHPPDYVTHRGIVPNGGDTEPDSLRNIRPRGGLKPILPIALIPTPLLRF
ncbi:MAG: hypothetical protein HXX08_22655 [Chloroflexi bacterium]|uniref:Uncharacterized protein n=1 Tax=Candidatus Chlorohelix allophototropha TaxID=3003348 RepID=A0A8T7M9E9_9CHLR|nr:hypothetical protein [Chloroflexota bacterium]WJW68601.1 hypothetical protein OZ401_004215 [Chloroflexota bacterium L227-S17]